MLPMHPSLDDTCAGQHGPAFDELKAFIVSTTGHARLAERDDLLLEKIARRIALQRLPSLDSYLDLVKHGADGKAELDCLIAELTVGETSFFRHRDHFDALVAHVLPDCLKRNAAARQLRIWSAGCANGAEAYSIAVVVHALLGDRLGDWNVDIVGSDLNRAFLAEAEKGLYSAWTLREVPAEQRPIHFVRRDDGWLIREAYKRNVQFVYHNLVSGEFPCLHKNIFAFDIIMCRNVMIYLDAVNNRQLAQRLRTVLVEDGYLFTGPADFNPHLEETFALEKVAGTLLYRSRVPPVPSRTPVPVSGGTAQRPGAATSVGETSVPRKRVADPRGENLRRVRSTASKCEGSRGAARPADAPQPSIETIIDLANKGDWVAAAHYCEAFLRADSCNAPAQYYYALVQQYSGAADAAEQALKRAIYLDSRFALAHYQLGLVRKDTHGAAVCIRSFQNVLDALHNLPDDDPVSPCGQITALNLRELATQQLEILAQQRAEGP